jgi:hypothetical protein
VGTPQIPQNQQDALPLATIATALGGDVQIIGTALTRYFSHLALGSPTFVAVSTGGMLRTPTLDLRGCNRFAFVVKRSFFGGGDLANNLTFGIVYGFSDGTFPTNANLFAHIAADTMREDFRMSGYNLAVGEPNPMVFAFAWGDPSGAWNKSPGNQTAPYGAFIGQSIQMYLMDAVAPNPNQTFNVELWGAQ